MEYDYGLRQICVRRYSLYLIYGGAYIRLTLLCSGYVSLAIQIWRF